MSLFVDTSIWYAAADSSDRNNARSKAILKSGETLVTSDHVLVETWTLLHHKLDRKAAERFWEGLRSGIAVIEAVTLADLEVAWDLGDSWRDQDFSIVDRIFDLGASGGSDIASNKDSMIAEAFRSTRRKPRRH